MLTGGSATLALTIIKIATALTVSGAVIHGVHYFNNYEVKKKEKKSRGGKESYATYDVEHLHEAVRSKR